MAPGEKAKKKFKTGSKQKATRRAKSVAKRGRAKVQRARVGTSTGRAR